MVELALSFTLVMFLMAGSVDIGRAYFAWISLRDASQEGALYGSLFPTDSTGMILHARSSSTDPVDLSDAGIVGVTTVINGSACANSTATNSVTVTVTLQFDFIMPGLGALLPSQTIPLVASMTNTILRPVC